MSDEKASQCPPQRTSTTSTTSGRSGSGILNTCQPGGDASSARLPPDPLPWAHHALRVPALLSRPAVWKGLCTTALQVNRGLHSGVLLSGTMNGSRTHPFLCFLGGKRELFQVSQVPVSFLPLSVVVRRYARHAALLSERVSLCRLFQFNCLQEQKRKKSSEVVAPEDDLRIQKAMHEVSKYLTKHRAPTVRSYSSTESNSSSSPGNIKQGAPPLTVCLSGAPVALSFRLLVNFFRVWRRTHGVDLHDLGKVLLVLLAWWFSAVLPRFASPAFLSVVTLRSSQSSYLSIMSNH